MKNSTVTIKKSTILKVVVGLIGGALLFALGACTNQATLGDQDLAERQLAQYQLSQPPPFFDWSQYRETIISVETAQANGTATTTFFFNQGVHDPIKVCDSVGYAVPTTAQLTNPQKAVGSGATIAQLEPNGTFTGDSSGTYAVCLINGKPSPSYWEGYVETEPGKAHWDTQKGIVNDGDPTFVVKTKR